MTIFYSMTKLLHLSKNNSTKIIELIQTKSPIIKGDSYLLNPDKLLNSIVSNTIKAEYILFASYRSYADYILLGIDYLDISYIPDLDVTKVNRNPLISIENNRLIFNKEK